MKPKQTFPVGRKLLAAVMQPSCSLPKEVQQKLANIQSLMVLPKE